jgi:hypothetical protein
MFSGWPTARRGRHRDSRSSPSESTRYLIPRPSFLSALAALNSPRVPARRRSAAGPSHCRRPADDSPDQSTPLSFPLPGGPRRALRPAAARLGRPATCSSGGFTCSRLQLGLVEPCSTRRSSIPLREGDSVAGVRTGLAKSRFITARRIAHRKLSRNGAPRDAGAIASAARPECAHRPAPPCPVHLRPARLALLRTMRWCPTMTGPARPGETARARWSRAAGVSPGERAGAV